MSAADFYLDACRPRRGSPASRRASICLTSRRPWRASALATCVGAPLLVDLVLDLVEACGRAPDRPWSTSNQRKPRSLVCSGASSTPTSEAKAAREQLGLVGQIERGAVLVAALRRRRRRSCAPRGRRTWPLRPASCRRRARPRSCRATLCTSSAARSVAISFFSVVGDLVEGLDAARRDLDDADDRPGRTGP